MATCLTGLDDAVVNLRRSPLSQFHLWSQPSEKTFGELLLLSGPTVKKSSSFSRPANGHIHKRWLVHLCRSF